MSRAPLAALAVAISAWLTLLAPAAAIEWTSFEGAARGFPVLRDLSGKRLADGEFAQWLDGDRLYVVITYAFSRGRRIEERVVFRQRPQLLQDAWSWREQRNGRTYRQYTVDFPSGRATAAAPDEAGLLRWEGPLAEPDDQMVRVDLLPGTHSGPAVPVGTGGVR